MRFLFYSHDSYGLGHLRRSVTIASRLLERLPGASVLIATGSPVATSFKLPHGVDILKLPSVTKDTKGGYVPREWPMKLPDLLSLRAQLLASAVDGFRPNVMLVDHKPVGLLGELDLALARAREIGTRCILGLRDIIDHPDALEAEWNSDRVQDSLAHDYAKVMIYGDRRIFDASAEYVELRPALDRIAFTGYVVRPRQRPHFRPLALLHPQVLVTVGGGEDGATRVQTYLDALEGEPVRWNSNIILGPLFGSEAGRRVKQRARGLGGVTVHRSHNDLPGLMRDSSAVVSMAGYNTCAEIIQARIPSLLLPRVRPRREQHVRAQRLAAHGLSRNLNGAGPEELRTQIESALQQGRVKAEPPAMDGAEKAVTVLLQHAAHRPGLGPTPEGSYPGTSVPSAADLAS